MGSSKTRQTLVLACTDDSSDTLDWLLYTYSASDAGLEYENMVDEFTMEQAVQEDFYNGAKSITICSDGTERGKALAEAAARKAWANGCQVFMMTESYTEDQLNAACTDDIYFESVKNDMEVAAQPYTPEKEPEEVAAATKAELREAIEHPAAPAPSPVAPIIRENNERQNMKLFEAAKTIPAYLIAKEIYHVKLKPAKGGNYTGVCLLHDDRHPSCTYFKDGGFFCYACGATGSGIDLVSKHDMMPEADAARFICESFNVDYDGRKPSKKGKAPSYQFPKPQVEKPEQKQEKPEKAFTSQQVMDFMKQLAKKNNWDYSRHRIHSYTDKDGKEVGVKIIIPPNGEGKKNIVWVRPSAENPEKFVYKGMIVQMLFRTKELAENLTSDVVFTEGEKDADTVAQKLGYMATTAPNGGHQTEWHEEWDEYLKQRKKVFILTDNDATGAKYGEFIAENATKLGCKAYIIPATAIYPEAQTKWDISDILEAVGLSECRDLLNAAITKVQEEEPYAPKASETPAATEADFALFKPLTSYEEKEQEWTVKGRIPKGAITVIAGNGGTGKSGMMARLAAAITTGKRCLLDPRNTIEEATEFSREAGTVLFCSVEDSVSSIKRRMRIAGADLTKVLLPDFLDDKDGKLAQFKMGTPFMEQVIAQLKPTICVFDPLQSFLPPEINMSARNQMRQSIQQLTILGEKYGTSFIILAHTNKRQNASGRDRIADSADLWDIARSVFITGLTDRDGIRYFSHEKVNDGALAPTILYEIKEEGLPVYVGETQQRDEEFQSAKAFDRSAPNRDSCVEEFRDILWNNSQTTGSLGMKVQEVEERLKDAGFSTKAIRKAKEFMKQNQEIHYAKTGDAWTVSLTDQGAEKLFKAHENDSESGENTQPT